MKYHLLVEKTENKTGEPVGKQQVSYPSNDSPAQEQYVHPVDPHVERYSISDDMVSVVILHVYSAALVSEHQSQSQLQFSWLLKQTQGQQLSQRQELLVD